MMYRRSSARGFTLIELMVVIAIIGVLASEVMVALNLARARGRDVARITQMREVQKALEMYYAEHGKYPGSAPGGTPRVNSCFSNGTQNDGQSDWSSLQALITDGDISSLPQDPLNNGHVNDWQHDPDYCYGYLRSDQWTSGNSIWTACTDTTNIVNHVANPPLHSLEKPGYILYFSLEHPDKWDLSYYSGGNGSRPFTSCILGTAD